MQKKTARDLPLMSKEDFLEKFYDGKINYKLPSKYPENFSICKSYLDGKKEIPLQHKDKVTTILKDLYNAVKPVVKKFKLSLGLLVESAVTFKGVAWTRKIKIDFSTPASEGKREELIAYTSMIEIKIRNKEFPQNQKKFLNKTTLLAIMLHELAHVRHMNHNIEFALFLQEIYQYAMTLGLFTEDEEHMMPSSRPWEIRMFETKGKMNREELDTFFEGDNCNQGMDDHGDDWEHGEHNHAEDEKEDSKTAVKSTAIIKSETNKEEPKKEKTEIHTKPKEKIVRNIVKEKAAGHSSLNEEKNKKTAKQTVETVKLEKPKKTVDIKSKTANLNTHDKNKARTGSTSSAIGRKAVRDLVEIVKNEVNNIPTVNVPPEIGIEVMQEAS